MSAESRRKCYIYSLIQMIMRFLKSFAGLLFVAVALLSCERTDPASTKDPLPLPPGMEDNKDLTVEPGDSFYDYCNGTWLKNTPIPATGAAGGVYDQFPAMEKRMEQLKAENAVIHRMYELLDAQSGQPEASKVFIDDLKARFPRPTTKSELFVTLGKMLAEGFPLWGHAIMPAWGLTYKNGRLMCTINPPFLDVSPLPDLPKAVDPDELVPISLTKAGGGDSPVSLIIQGLGLDPSLFVENPSLASNWEKLNEESLEGLLEIYDSCWRYLENFAAEQLTKEVRTSATFAFSYTLSYHLVQKYISPAFKEKYLNIVKEIQASLRKRIERVEWMSQTTKNNALEKLDCCGLNVAYPDKWYEDCLVDMSECKTLAEAVYRGNRGNALLKKHLIGGNDTFSLQILSATLDADGFVPTDLSLVNAFYSAMNNAIYIYPAILLPPLMPENVSQAYEYAVFTVMGHEFTHGFDSNIGSKYDKMGNKRNWWTVADQMAFEERRDILANCYSHLEIDPVRVPGTFSDGLLTQGEDIADLGGFLTTLDAYKARLESEGYSGETFRQQLRKFFESYADLWKTVYSDKKLASFPQKDEHSHARLRVNGVVMNTDLWYDLYDVDRNNILYLPPERRAVIW